MNDAYSKLVFRNDDGVYLRLVSEITFYWRGSIIEHKNGLLKFYRRALELIGDGIRFFRTESMSRSRPLKPESLELLPGWLAKTKAKRGIYMLSLESGGDRDEPSEHALYFLADEEETVKTGLIRLLLPPTFMDAGIGAVLPLVRDLASDLAFESGHAGFSVNWDPEGESEDEAARTMTMIGKKYPGVDLNYVDSTIIAFQKSSRPSIKCANWLTFVGGRIAAQLPAPDPLRNALGASCHIHTLGTGLILQAGDRPVLGYPRKSDLSPYVAIGSQLSNFRLQNHPQIFADPDPQSTEEWLARFDHR